MSWRHEQKYSLDAPRAALLSAKTACVAIPDPHAGADGRYLVRSLYLDDLFDTCYRDNLRGTEPRAKYRLRYYGNDTGYLLLEKKTRMRGLCRKESCRITEEQCAAFLRGEPLCAAPEDDDTKKRLCAEVTMRALRPNTIVTYSREPYVYSAGNVRVTFDRALRSSDETDRFLQGDYRSRPVFGIGDSILEVKWDELLPKHIRGVLQLDGLTWTAYSKYCACRKFHL